jgi:hypothetical protein
MSSSSHHVPLSSLHRMSSSSCHITVIRVVHHHCHGGYLAARNACLSRAAGTWRHGELPSVLVARAMTSMQRCRLTRVKQTRRSEVHEGAFVVASVAGRDDRDGEDDTCACARAIVASLPSINTRTAPSTSRASAALTIAPGGASNLAYPRVTRSSSVIPISSSTHASSLKSSKRARIVCNADVGGLETQKRTSER